jgi:Skp family chaperone for outer membrane proteins
MKKILFLIALSLPILVSAQDNPQRDNKLQSLEIAYLTKELNLSPEEAQRFWPVYNKYSAEMKQTLRSKENDPDVLDKQQKLLDIRKKYRSEFLKVLSPDRVNQVFTSEVKFREMVRRELQERQAQKRFKKG